MNITREQVETIAREAAKKFLTGVVGLRVKCIPLDLESPSQVNVLGDFEPILTDIIVSTIRSVDTQAHEILYDPLLTPIDNFEAGEHKFLSNFYMDRLTVFGMNFDSLEHAYQAMKANNLGSAMLVNGQFFQVDDRVKDGVRIVHNPHGPGVAKKRGRKITCRTDWDDIKIAVMDFLLALKFNNPTMAAWLLATGERQLIEGNHWNDVYWGRCNGVGENNLGIRLMKRRLVLKQHALMQGSHSGN